MFAVEQLIDILWPDPSKGDGQKASTSRFIACAALLGSDDVITVGESLRFLQCEPGRVDLWR